MQRDQAVPVRPAGETVGLAHEPVEVTEREQPTQVGAGPRVVLVADQDAMSTRSTTKTSVSPGPITLPAPRSA